MKALLQEIRATIISSYNVDITLSTRRAEVVSARCGVMMALTDYTTDYQVAKLFGMNHASVHNCKKQHETRMSYDKLYDICYNLALNIIEDAGHKKLSEDGLLEKEYRSLKQKYLAAQEKAQAAEARLQQAISKLKVYERFAKEYGFQPVSK